MKKISFSPEEDIHFWHEEDTLFGPEEDDPKTYLKRELLARFIRTEDDDPLRSSASIGGLSKMEMMPWFDYPRYGGHTAMPMTMYDPWWNINGIMRAMENSRRSSTLPNQMPWLNRMDTGLSELINDKEKFVIKLDANQFKPEELSIKVIDNRIVIHGKHEEKKDGDGFIKREFTRAYWLPKGVQPENIKSEMTTGGQLTIMAPKKTSEDSKERKIPIERK
uniref:SHSP domain-containing protein n=1 Tax=Trichuris muris TaxID=70415 RepID=A0A5S6Q8N9_TRIMR